MGNAFPGKLVNNDTTIEICYRSTNGNLSDDSNVLSPLTKHCGGFVRESTFR
jgi:hypothetical protein